MHLHLPHLPVPHPAVLHLAVRRLPRRDLSVPAALLAVVYAAAVGVALSHPGAPTLAGLVVLAGLVARFALGSRHTSAPAALGVAETEDAGDAVLTPEPAPAAAA